MAATRPNASDVLRPDPAALADWWRAVVRPGDVHEVRLPKTRKGPLRLFGVASGYFDDGEAFVAALARVTGFDAEGAYLTLNPVDPRLLGRAANRLVDGKPVTTADADIARRRHLLVDVDPDVPAGVSATDDERAVALARRDAILAALTEAGWPPPVAVLSTGNGGGLLYRVRGANTPEAAHLVARALEGIKAAFAGDGARVDTTVHNAARIAKVAGTVSAKGDDLPERPWRLAEAEYRPDPLPVPPALLEAVAGWAPEPAYRGAAGGLSGDVTDRLRAAGVGFRTAEKAWATVHTLDRCLTSADHAGDTATAIFVFPSGALDYRCLHARCAGKRWADVRERLGYGDRPPEPTILIGGRRASDEATTDANEPTAGPAFDAPPAAAVRGWFRDYLDLVEPTTEAADAFHLGAALTLVGAMIGRGVRTEYASDPLYANLYTVLVGPSGSSRKDTAIKRALAVPQLQMGSAYVQPAYYLVTDVGSAEGLLTVLKDHPNCWLYVTELSTLLRNARRKATLTILPRLIEAWDTPAVLQNMTKGAPVVAVKPYLSVVAATQPGTLAGEMTAEDIHSGFANRLLILPGVGKPARPHPAPLDKPRAWELYLSLKAQIKEYGEDAVLPVDPACGPAWDRWYERHHAASGRDEDEDAMRVRHATLIRKLALIYAVADDARAIGPDHQEAAVALVGWMWGHVRVLLKEWGVAADRRIEERILAALARHGALSRRALQMRTASRQWGARDFAATFKAMAENGTVVVDRATGLVALGTG